MDHPSRADRIRDTIEAAFPCRRIEVTDQSALHAGHAGSSGAGETHYELAIVSDRFTGMNRLARSRLVHEVLDPEFRTGLHALSLRLTAPE